MSATFRKESSQTISVEVNPKTAERAKSAATGKWLEAFSDPMASLFTFQACAILSDVQGDGDAKLAVAACTASDYSMKLKVYNGTFCHS